MTFCAWCTYPVLSDLVDWHGVPFHNACWAERAHALEASPEAAADFVVDVLGPVLPSRP